MSTTPAVQDFSAAITWTQDWSAHLTANGGLTITGTPTATCPDVRVTVASPTITGSGTSVTFKVSQTGMPTTGAIPVVVTVGVTLSNGDVDQRDFPIGFTNT